jgi:hypothetical protein
MIFDLIKYLLYDFLAYPDIPATQTNNDGMAGKENFGQLSKDPEWMRLQEDEERAKNWKRWGPYLSERQWGTVREVNALFLAHAAGLLARWECVGVLLA